MQVNIHEAKTTLSKLIEKAVQGEDVIIAKAGIPAVRLVKIAEKKRVFGSAAGTIEFTEGWDAPMTPAEIEAITSR